MRRLRRLAGAVLLAGALNLPTALPALQSATPPPAGDSAVAASVTIERSATAPPAAPADPRATATPTPTETPPTPALREDVADWFSAEALEAVEDAEVVDGDEFDVGRPRRVTTWSAEFISGDTRAEPVERLDEWVAPVTEPPEEDGDPVPVAVVRAADPLELLEVEPDPELAGALAGLAPGATVVRDPAVAGWFALADGEVWPITAEARTVLQGSLAVDVFQSFLSERMGVATATPEPVAEDAEEESLTPLAAIIVILGLGAGAAWLLVRQYRRTDSRIAADVHAGLSPPRHEEGPGR